MARQRKHPRRAYRCIDSFAGTDPETKEPYGAHRGEIWLDGPMLRKCLMYFEPLDDDFPLPAELIERVSSEPVLLKDAKEVK